MSRYDHKIETSLEGIEHLSKEKKEEKERKMKEKNHYYNPLINEVLKDKEKIEKGSRIIEKKPRNNLCYTFSFWFSISFSFMILRSLTNLRFTNFCSLLVFHYNNSWSLQEI